MEKELFDDLVAALNESIEYERRNIKHLDNMNIEYKKDLSEVTEAMFLGFFEGWANPPSAATHLAILQNSYRAFVAVDKECNRVVGFINAVSDGILTAYIPLLEVVKSYQGMGIGSNLVKLMLAELENMYMIDICHDAELSTFYAKFGTFRGHASLFRNFTARYINT